VPIEVLPGVPPVHALVQAAKLGRRVHHELVVGIDGNSVHPAARTGAGGGIDPQGTDVLQSDLLGPCHEAREHEEGDEQHEVAEKATVAAHSFSSSTWKIGASKRPAR
jgi:hypothetical protein